MSIETRNQAIRTLQNNFGWSIAIGILMIILGIIAIARPIFATVATNFLLGWIFIIAGIVQLFYAFKTRGAGPFFLKLLLSILYICVGTFLLTNPLAGIISLTLLVGIFFLVEGFLEVIEAFQLKPLPYWGWTLFNGIVAIILGILIWSQWPSNASWVIGLLVGIKLFVTGISTVMLSTAARKSLREA